MRSDTCELWIVVVGLALILCLMLAPTPRCEAWGRGLFGGCPVVEVEK